MIDYSAVIAALLNLQVALIGYQQAHAADLDFTSTSTIAYYASNEALRANLSPTEVLGTLQCESGMNPASVGDHGTSFGVAQWHISAHNMTKEEALDPKYAIDKMIEAWINGHQRWWSCARKLYHY